MRARDLIRRLVPRWLDARQALALSNLCMSASEAVWDVHEEKMHRYVTGRAMDDPVYDFSKHEPRPCSLDDLPF
jgi:hypothetical protein